MTDTDESLLAALCAVVVRLGGRVELTEADFLDEYHYQITTTAGGGYIIESAQVINGEVIE